MGCPSNVVIGDNLVFSICTHDPDTGVVTDADFDPLYRVYVDETAVPILSGTMSKLDDVNTTGFYSESIACTVLNGFAEHLNYNIYIEATVDADPGAISYAFKCEPLVSAAGAIWDTLVGAINVVGSIGVWVKSLINGRYSFNKGTGVEVVSDAVGNVLSTRTITDTAVVVTKT